MRFVNIPIVLLFRQKRQISFVTVPETTNQFEKHPRIPSTTAPYITEYELKTWNEMKQSKNLGFFVEGNYEDLPNIAGGTTTEICISDFDADRIIASIEDIENALVQVNSRSFSIIEISGEDIFTTDDIDFLRSLQKSLSKDEFSFASSQTFYGTEIAQGPPFFIMPGKSTRDRIRRFTNSHPLANLFTDFSAQPASMSIVQLNFTIRLVKIAVVHLKEKSCESTYFTAHSHFVRNYLNDLIKELESFCFFPTNDFKERRKVMHFESLRESFTNICHDISSVIEIMDSFVYLIKDASLFTPANELFKNIIPVYFLFVALSTARFIDLLDSVNATVISQVAYLWHQIFSEIKLDQIAHTYLRCGKNNTLVTAGIMTELLTIIHENIRFSIQHVKKKLFEEFDHSSSKKQNEFPKGDLLAVVSACQAVLPQESHILIMQYAWRRCRADWSSLFETQNSNIFSRMVSEEKLQNLLIPSRLATFLLLITREIKSSINQGGFIEIQEVFHGALHMVQSFKNYFTSSEIGIIIHACATFRTNVHFTSENTGACIVRQTIMYFAEKLVGEANTEESDETSDPSEVLFQNELKNWEMSTDDICFLSESLVLLQVIYPQQRIFQLLYKNILQELHLCINNLSYSHFCRLIKILTKEHPRQKNGVSNDVSWSNQKSLYELVYRSVLRFDRSLQNMQQSAKERILQHLDEYFTVKLQSPSFQLD